MAAGCVVNSTPSKLSTICSGTVTLTVSPLIAAAYNSAATCCHVDLARVSAGRCFSINFRTSASVRIVITPGITSGRGSACDQFGRVTGLFTQLAQLGGLPELNNFSDFVLAARAFICSLIVTRLVGKDANERHSRSASRTRGTCHDRQWNLCSCSHFCLPRNIGFAPHRRAKIISSTCHLSVKRFVHLCCLH